MLPRYSRSVNVSWHMYFLVLCCYLCKGKYISFHFLHGGILVVLQTQSTVQSNNTETISRDPASGNVGVWCIMMISGGV